MSIIGGEPLAHPRIEDIVKLVHQRGWKPIVHTNGVKLSPDLLTKLKNAGAFGFIFHIDISQSRKGYSVEREERLNVLRQRYAEMLASEGGLSCSFSQRVTRKTLSQIGGVARWALKRPDIVHTLTFVLSRQIRMRDVLEELRAVDLAFEPSACLHATDAVTDTRTFMAARIANRRHGLGYVSPYFMETIQLGHRLLRKKWLTFAPPLLLRTGGVMSVAMSLFDRRMREIATRQLKLNLKHPTSVLEPLFVQSFLIVESAGTRKAA